MHRSTFPLLGLCTWSFVLGDWCFVLCSLHFVLCSILMLCAGPESATYGTMKNKAQSTKHKTKIQDLKPTPLTRISKLLKDRLWSRVAPEPNTRLRPQPPT